MKHRAFTLFEVSVVLAIIGGAAVLWFPLFARPKECCRAPSCQSNLKQIMLGFLQYTQNNDEKFPPVAVAWAGNWAGSLQPYAKSWKIF